MQKREETREAMPPRFFSFKDSVAQTYIISCSLAKSAYALENVIESFSV